MIDFNVVPSTPVVDTPSADGGAEGADARAEGAFAEMLSRSLGRELVGRYAQWGHDLSGERGAADDHSAEHDGEALSAIGVAAPPADAALVLDGGETRVPGHAQPWGVEPITTNTNPAAGTPTADVPVGIEPAAAPRTVIPLGATTEEAVRSAGVAPDRGATNPTQRLATHPPVLDAEAQLPRRVAPNGGAAPRTAGSPQRWDPAAVRALRPDLMTSQRAASAASVAGAPTPLAERPAVPRSEILAGRAAAAAERSRGAELDAVRALEALEAAEQGPSPVAVAAGGRSVAVVPMGTPASQPVASGLVERIVQVVEMQRNQPPPRAIAVDLPEFDGLRLVVSMRGDGTVHVAPSGAAVTHSVVSPLLAAVGEALAENGFQLAADGERGRRSPEQEERPAPRPQSTPPRRTIGARRAGLRI